MVSIPDIDARNNLLVNEGLLKLVRLLVALLNGKLLDLGQLARERLVLTTCLSEIKKLYFGRAKTFVQKNTWIVELPEVASERPCSPLTVD